MPRTLIEMADAGDLVVLRCHRGSWQGPLSFVRREDLPEFLRVIEKLRRGLEDEVPPPKAPHLQLVKGGDDA